MNSKDLGGWNIFLDGKRRFRQFPQWTAGGGPETKAQGIRRMADCSNLGVVSKNEDIVCMYAIFTTDHATQ